MSPLRTGIVGVGQMGGRIAARVREAGDPIVAYDRDAERLATSGLSAAGSLAELVADVDVVLLSLPDSSVIEPVILGAGGVLEHARPEQVPERRGANRGVERSHRTAKLGSFPWRSLCAWDAVEREAAHRLRRGIASASSIMTIPRFARSDELASETGRSSATGKGEHHEALDHRGSTSRNE